jgi:hypothetical protein
MAISYPVSVPSGNAIKSISFRAQNAVAYSRSPFTYKGQAHAYAGEMWEVDVTLKPMSETEAENWSAFLTSLRGQFGTFFLGDPFRYSPRGTATSATITGAAGDRSVTVAMTGTMKVGQYFSLGSGTSTRLYKVLAEQNNDGTLEIWPSLRAAASTASATLTSPIGTFRLASNSANWTVNNLAHYGITFGAMEAL